MQPSKEQIEAAARLVPDVFISSHGHSVEWIDDTGQTYRPWQPWADTKAGRSDALVLLAAVMHWIKTCQPHEYLKIDRHWGKLLGSLDTGNFQKIQAATFAAAVAIGAHMGVGRGQ